jgi:ADP-ribose pyrophosphatase YjhB (NUDIX family)
MLNCHQTYYLICLTVRSEKVTLEKVSILITRKNHRNRELLLFQHPSAGIQIPAGTVEPNEDHTDAAVREMNEETGIEEIQQIKYIGSQEIELPGDQYIILNKTIVYSRPDPTSFDWAEIRRGIKVDCLMSDKHFKQIQYREYDQINNPNYISYEIRGWVNNQNITKRITRHFYHIEVESNLDQWEQFTDNHNFQLFWAPLHNLPEIVSAQYEWLTYITEKLQYKLE